MTYWPCLLLQVVASSPFWFPLAQNVFLHLLTYVCLWNWSESLAGSAHFCFSRSITLCLFTGEFNPFTYRDPVDIRTQATQLLSDCFAFVLFLLPRDFAYLLHTGGFPRWLALLPPSLSPVHLLWVFTLCAPGALCETSHRESGPVRAICNKTVTV